MNEIKPHIINTERLLLRALTPDNYNQVLGTYSDVEIKSFFGIHTDVELELEKERFRQGMTMAGKSFLYFHIIEKNTNEVMGWCGYHTWFTQHARAEIGYVLNHISYMGKGFMKEAIKPIVRYGFEIMKLNRIEALIAPGNEPSLKLVKGLGFMEEGLLREHYCKNGKLEDSVVFSLLRADFNNDSL